MIVSILLDSVQLVIDSKDITVKNLEERMDNKQAEDIKLRKYGRENLA